MACKAHAAFRIMVTMSGCSLSVIIPHRFRSAQEKSGRSGCNPTLPPQKSFPTRGNTVVVDPAAAPWDTQPGLTEGSRCTVCGQVLTVPERIPPPVWDIEGSNAGITILTEILRNRRKLHHLRHDRRCTRVLHRGACLHRRKLPGECLHSFGCGLDQRHSIQYGCHGLLSYISIPKSISGAKKY